MLLVSYTKFVPIQYYIKRSVVHPYGSAYHPTTLRYIAFYGHSTTYMYYVFIYIMKLLNITRRHNQVSISTSTTLKEECSSTIDFFWDCLVLSTNISL